jgi:signal transduction histidine kinase
MLEGIWLRRALALPSDWPAIGRIAAGLAHEIRNPISAMRLKAENALATADEQRALSSTYRFINSRILQGPVVIAEGRADAAVTYMREGLGIGRRRTRRHSFDRNGDLLRNDRWVE